MISEANAGSAHLDPVEGAVKRRRMIICYHTEVISHPVFHTHDFCEIYYSVSGGNSINIGGHCYEAAPGDVFIVAPGERHRMTGHDPQHYERFVVFAAPDFIENVSTPQTDLTSVFLRHSADFCHCRSLGRADRSRLELLLKKLYEPGGFASELLEAAAFLELLALLAGFYLLGEEERRPGRRSLAPELMHYIEERIDKPLAVSQIASAFFISESYACRVFKQEYGLTINKYIQERRMGMAKALLCQGFTVAETCERCGYNDYSHFIKTFTRVVGMSPKRYAISSSQQASEPLG